MFDTRKVVSYNTKEQLLLRWPTVPSISMFSSLCFSKILGWFDKKTNGFQCRKNE